MGSSGASTLSKVNILLSFAGFVIYVVGLAAPYWMSASFVLPIPPPDGIPVDDHMGLFMNCKELHFHSRSHSECGTEGAMGWQFIAAAMAILGVFAGLTATITSIVNGCVRRCARKPKLMVVTTIMCFLAASFMMAPVLMYGINNQFQVDPNLYVVITFNQDWAFKLCAAGMCVFGLLVLTNVLDIITLRSTKDVDDLEMTGNSRYFNNAQRITRSL